jgi:hypothetical protein
MAAHRQNPADLLHEYSVAELECIAEKFHGGLGDKFEIPVDVDLLLESADGVDLDVWPGLSANHKLLGMAGIDPATKIIFVYIDDKLADTSANTRRYRMTVAEELAHILIHRPAIEAVKTVEDFELIQGHHKWHSYERNAKRLAAALLMPAPYLLKDARELYGKIITVLPDPYMFPDLIKNKIIGLLADKYLVSVESMKYRLKEWPISVIDKIDKAVDNKFDFLE